MKASSHSNAGLQICEYMSSILCKQKLTKMSGQNYIKELSTQGQTLPFPKLSKLSL